MRRAALLLLATALARPGAAPGVEPPTAADGGAHRDEATDGGAAASDSPDPELLDHLDELERLELLRNLELFEGDGPADGGAGR